MNQKELEEEQKLIAVNQIRKSELKAKQKMYSSSTTFGRKMVSQYTLTFAEFLKNKIETTIKGRATSRNFVQAIPLMLDLIQLVDPERISIITLKSILDNVHRCEHSIPKYPEVVLLISTRIEDEARVTYYKNKAPREIVTWTVLHLKSVSERTKSSWSLQTLARFILIAKGFSVST